MQLEYYTPTGSEILFTEVREEKTAGGIYIPSSDFLLRSHSDMFEQEKIEYDGSKSKLGKYEVVKVGDAVVNIQPGDTIILRTGANPETIEFDEGTYFQVVGAYVIGRERRPR